MWNGPLHHCIVLGNPMDVRMIAGEVVVNQNLLILKAYCTYFPVSMLDHSAQVLLQ